MAEAASRRLTTACALELMRVRTEDGRALGHVFDLRCKTGPGKAPTVTAIVYGERGLLERLGLRHARPTFVPWERVRSIEGRVVVVADDAPRPGGSKR
jgi:sporulation protein YlmC with PRC-barrel domain